MAAGSLRKLDLGLDQRSAVFFFMAAVVCCESIKLHLTRRPWNLVVFQLLKQVNRVRNIESAGTGGKKLA